MSKIAVFLPVYNEEAYIAKTISSILVQDYADFDLLISENHSTDGTLEILRRFQAQDSRIKVLRPEQKLNSYGNFCFLAQHVNQGEYLASMMLGGHDLVSHNVLSTAAKHLAENPSCAIAYQRSSFEMDELDRATRKWPVCHESGYMNTSFDAILTLITLMYNTPIFGLWRQSVRQRAAFRYPCVGGDHLYVAEAALYGSITPIDGAQIYLRRSPATANYLQKHFTDRSGDQAAADDMYTQLNWLSDIVDQSAAGYPAFAQELLRSSAISLYLLRYNHHFATFHSSLNAFAEQPEVSHLIQSQVALGGALKSLLKAKQGDCVSPL
jgi:cellulose synthase/poly-beta-1,6-N-acetylglucosamine synthase-like glycosyltransferase